MRKKAKKKPIKKVKKAKKQAKIPHDLDTLDTERDKKGRFVSGHKGITSPDLTKTKKLKEALLAAVSEKDIKDIIKKQIDKAKKGNNESAKIVLDRCLGKPKETGDLNINIPQLSKPLTLEEMKKRILEADKAGTGIDQRSIEGGKTS